VGEKSFDPRTWLSPGEDAAAGAAETNASFDVRSWVSSDGAAARSNDSRDAPRRSRKALVVAGSVVLVVAAGVALASGWGGGSDAAGRPAPALASGPAGDAPAGDKAESRTLMISSPAGIAEALTSAGVPRDEVGEFASRAVAALGDAAGDVRLAFVLTADSHLRQLQATRQDGSGLAIERTADGLKARKIAANLEKRISSVRGEMDGDSFYTSAVAAGVDDSLIDAFANAFSFDFNLQLEVHAGDVFEAAFEQAYNPSGQPVGRPSLLYVSLSTPTKSRALYRFTAPGDTEPSWFDGNGRSNVRALMMTPVDGARISSKFGPRFHPVLHYTRNHNGTDFAAPIGTPIYAAGNGVVTTASPSKCAGNMVILKHDNGWETRYFHLSRYADGLAVGERVKQGTVIGYIGVTGTCTTGPHLHFEVHIGGVPVDPLSVDTGKGKALSGAALAAFIKERDRIDRVRSGQTT
jgi:murein DD-endopeptidase MepM/ murein hydrolase activator NlpD